MNKTERKEIKKILRQQLELLAKLNEKCCTEDTISTISHAIVEIVEIYRNI